MLKGTLVMAIYILIAAALVLLVGFIWLYNLLVSQWQMVNNGWADIDVQLKRRSDLVPRLVEVVSAYAAHERNLFEDLAEKRTLAEAAGEDPARRAKAEEALSRPVRQLLALAEAYPDLKASNNFADLQGELVDTENKIEMARRFYNGAVRELNTTVESLPANLVAPLIGFSPRSYFEIGSADREAPQVRLTPT
jgi:LemA protein